MKQPVEAEKIKDFYQKWYTPDAMTLLVVGNVDARSVVDQINKTFGELKGKRETPAPVPTLSPLRAEAVSIMTDAVRQDRLSIMWDTPWQPIRESAALLRYWRADLAREALFWHVQQALSASNSKDIGLGFDCRVLYLRAQCAINIESPNDKLNSNLNLVARELAKVRDKGLPEEEFNALVAQKKLELQKLFAAYAEKERISIAVGAFSSEKQPDVADRDVYGNSVFVFTPDGTMSAPYSKQHLVPFGEYLPYRRFFERFFPALADSAAFGTDLTAGNGTVLPETPVGKVGVQICYESVFGKYCRAQVNGGAEILLISTNDSTFGSSQALRHHLAQAQMRAIENNVPVLRAANTGISALITSDGRLVKTLGADETGYLAGLLPYGTGSTLYRAVGDSILLLFAALLLASYLYPKLSRKR